MSRWLSSKGLRSETLSRADVVFDERRQRLYFPYRRPGFDQGAQLRYIDLRKWANHQQDKYWDRGASGKGAYWPILMDVHYSSTSRSVLLCEGETDALMAVQCEAPFSLIAAFPGAHMLDTPLFDTLIRYGYELVLATDRDPAGDHASERAAWMVADRQPLSRLVYPDGVNDLRECLLLGPDYDYKVELVEQVPQIRPAPAVPSESPSWKRPPQSAPDEKPDLLRVWHALGLRTKSTRRDGKGRQVLQAWCPVHDDGAKPGAWVGADRWGCFVCGIESADVYELVAWVRGYATPEQELRGDAFTRARNDARSLS